MVVSLFLALLASPSPADLAGVWLQEGSGLTHGIKIDKETGRSQTAFLDLKPDGRLFRVVGHQTKFGSECGIISGSWHRRSDGEFGVYEDSISYATSYKKRTSHRPSGAIEPANEDQVVIYEITRLTPTKLQVKTEATPGKFETTTYTRGAYPAFIDPYLVASKPSKYDLAHDHE
jgi:hypothetical protein